MALRWLCRLSQVPPRSARRRKPWQPQQRCPFSDEPVEPVLAAVPPDHGYVPILSPRQITACLSQLETANSGALPPGQAVEGYASNQLGSNAPCEDRRRHARLLHEPGHLFAVFDGHGGHACAQAVSERLLHYVAVSLQPPHLLERYAHALKHDESGVELLRAYTSPGDYRTRAAAAGTGRNAIKRFVTEQLSTCYEEEPAAVDEALAQAFVRLDQDLGSECLPSTGSSLDVEALDAALSGACACVALVRGNELHVSNVGDTRAVLGHQRPGDGVWEAVPLSTDQNTDNAEEVARLRAEHPASEGTWILRNNRLLGALIPLRAFGDFRFKWPLAELRRLGALLGGGAGRQLVLPHYQSPPYLTARPMVQRRRLRPGDRFLVLATDGLWEQLDSGQVVRLVADYLQGRDMDATFTPTRGAGLARINQALCARKAGLAKRQLDANAATLLIRQALGGEHRKVSEMLTLPPEVARYYRDDITVTVVFFNQEELRREAHEPA